MTWTAPQINRQRTPIVAGERQMLEAWLDFHRQTLLGKCSGLTPGQLRQRSAPPSTLSLLGLVRHMTDVERGWSRAARVAVAARGARRAGCRGAPDRGERHRAVLRVSRDGRDRHARCAIVKNVKHRKASS